jgi:hypothetical protein
MNEPQTPAPFDKDELKKAYKAFKKRLKITRLDAESNLNFRPTSAGKHSSIVAIEPPLDFDRRIWDELVKQGKLKATKHGMYELVEEQD